MKRVSGYFAGSGQEAPTSPMGWLDDLTHIGTFAGAVCDALCELLEHDEAREDLKDETLYNLIWLLEEFNQEMLRRADGLYEAKVEACDEGQACSQQDAGERGEDTATT